jgi:uncharacterized protein YcfJ
MKIILKSIVVISFFIASQLAFAGSFVDSATVNSVEKVYKQYMVEEPYQDCYIKETLQQSGDGSATNEIMGAILGGAIGNQFGDGEGKEAMTLAGIFLGASIANDAEKANSTGQVVVSQEVCENKVRQTIEKRLSHYKINVEYEGRDLSFTSKKRPYDDVIKVKVTVSSLDE